MDDEQLSFRKMAIDGIEYADDWLVIWRSLTVGRILKQTGIPMSQANWWWGVNWDNRPQHANQRGVGVHLDDCKRQFHDAWLRVREGPTDADIEKARRHEAEYEARMKPPTSR